MGVIGRYLDALPDDARDRVIEAQRWVWHELVDGEGGGCLRGHAEGLAHHAVPMETLREWWRQDQRGPWRDLEAAAVFFWQFPCYRTRGNPAVAFNDACDRFGLERVVRLLKARAAKNHRPLLPAAVPQSQAVNV